MSCFHSSKIRQGLGYHSLQKCMQIGVQLIVDNILSQETEYNHKKIRKIINLVVTKLISFIFVDSMGNWITFEAHELEHS